MLYEKYIKKKKSEALLNLFGIILRKVVENSLFIAPSILRGKLDFISQKIVYTVCSLIYTCTHLQLNHITLKQRDELYCAYML